MHMVFKSWVCRHLGFPELGEENCSYSHYSHRIKDFECSRSIRHEYKITAYISF